MKLITARDLAIEWKQNVEHVEKVLTTCLEPTDFDVDGDPLYDAADAGEIISKNLSASTRLPGRWVDLRDDSKFWPTKQ